MNSNPPPQAFWEQTLGPERVTMAPPCPPPALIRTSCGWDYALLGMGGGGETGSQGWRKKSETNGGVVGAKDWQSAHRGLGSAL